MLGGVRPLKVLGNRERFDGQGGEQWQWTRATGQGACTEAGRVVDKVGDDCDDLLRKSGGRRQY